MKPKLSIETLKIEAKLFCEEQSKINHKSLIGVTDGKAHFFGCPVKESLTFKTTRVIKSLQILNEYELLKVESDK